MNDIHLLFRKSFQWYDRWHNHAGHTFAHWFLFVFIGVLISGNLSGQIANLYVSDSLGAQISLIPPKIITPRFMVTAGQYVDSKGAPHDIDVWEVTNIRNGDKEYFTLMLPKIGSAPYPVITIVNPYSVFPAPPSSNEEDILWSGKVKRSGPSLGLRIDESLPPENRVIRCSTPSGDCLVVHTGLANPGVLSTIFKEKEVKDIDWAITNGYAVAVAFARHYAGRDTITVVYGLHDILEGLKTIPEIDANGVGIIGESQGGQLSMHPLALPNHPLDIKATVAEFGWNDARAVKNYYLEELPRIQPPILYVQSHDFMAPYLNRFLPVFGDDVPGSLWDLATTDSIADRFNTPVLLIHGSDDMMIPVAQSVNFYNALKTRGKDAEKWTYENGSPPLATKSILQIQHGVLDANSSIKKNVLAWNFFLKHMPPNVPEVILRVPEDVDLVAMITEFRNKISAQIVVGGQKNNNLLAAIAGSSSAATEEENISELIIQASNPIIKYQSSDPRIPTSNGPTAVAAAMNIVLAGQGVNWSGNNLVSNLRAGLLSSNSVSSVQGVSTACTVTGARWVNSGATVGQTVSMIATVNDVQSCQGVNIGINIFEDDLVNDDLIVGPLVNPFSGSDVDFTVQYTLTAQNYADGDDGEIGGEEIYFTAAVPGQTNQATSSNINFGGQATGAKIDFDVDPRNVGNTPTTNKATAINKVDISLSDYSSYCGSQNITSFKYYVMWDYTSAVGARDQELYSETINFSRTSAVVNLNFNKTFTVSTGAGAQKLYGMIECPNNKNVTESGRVEVFVGIGQGTWSCVGPNASGTEVYICSDDNLTDCSDAPQCAGKTCSQIPSGLCGKPTGSVPPPTTSNPPPVSGITQFFKFSVPNPLQANNFTELIDVIATWLFNIAIPITVAMIVYAGVIFLISRGEPAKITQAKNILLYAVVGFAIILIGKGFITLIESILNLGAGS